MERGVKTMQMKRVFSKKLHLALALALGISLMLAVFPGQTSAAPVAEPYYQGEYWIDVDISNQTATAYIGWEPVYTAYVTTGVNGRTPVGDWYIFYRVYDEVMDSSTIGIPSNSPGGWYLPNVYFTQYFAPGGYSLHYNYWADRSVFGNRPSSAGCVGMEYEDAAYFWNFADIGTRVSVHY